MPRVTILRRDQTVLFPGHRQAEDAVEVSFASDAHGVGSTFLPVGSYRPATPDELAANPRYRMIPIDKAAEDAERKVIREALDRRADEQPASFDVP